MDDSLSISVDSRDSEQEAGIKETLRQATWDLSLRGLKSAAKWCAVLKLRQTQRPSLNAWWFCFLFFGDVCRAAELLNSLEDATNSSVTLTVSALDQVRRQRKLRPRMLRF